MGKSDLLKGVNLDKPCSSTTSPFPDPISPNTSGQVRLSELRSGRVLTCVEAAAQVVPGEDGKPRVLGSVASHRDALRRWKWQGHLG